MFISHTFRHEMLLFAYAVAGPKGFCFVTRLIGFCFVPRYDLLFACMLCGSRAEVVSRQFLFPGYVERMLATGAQFC